MRRHADYRQLIRDVLRDAAGPLTADDLRTALVETGIGIATVYRHLKAGLHDGDFVSVELPDGPLRFESASRPHHHYFACTRCEKVFDVEGDLDGIERLVPTGFELNDHEVILSGLCRDCVSSYEREC